MKKYSLLILLLPAVLTLAAGAGCDVVVPLLDTGGSTLSINSLPDEALDTIELIQSGGPYPYKQDNSVFSNREGLLPQEPQGYYREYTVETPGSADRGARRIIKGKGGEYYYTDDHYASFRLITGISGSAASASTTPVAAPKDSSGSISFNDIPPEARTTIQLIGQGGPYPYSQDGDIYHNREGLLPRQSDGYYHVYTVDTPGASDRGDRRMVTGKNGEYYYTDDHYGSFKTVAGVPSSAPGTSQVQPAVPQSGLGTIGVNDLPPEARETLRLIKKGGPFPYKQDNTVFSNYEGILPKQGSGYYHEYTVVTPGASNRGARRIVAGVPGEYYYTSDHYASFKRIVE